VSTNGIALPFLDVRLCNTLLDRCDTLGVVRSVRLDPELDRRVRKAAAVRGESVSAFIRNAVAERAEETLAEQGRERFRDVAGAVNGGGGRARRTGEAFAETIARSGIGG